MGLSLYTSFSDIKFADICIALFSIISLYIIHFYYKHFTRVNPLPGPIPIPLIGSIAIFIEDLDDWFHKLNKAYGKEGIYEVNIAGNRQIVITRAEHIDKFLVSSIHSGHLMRTANNGLLDLFDLADKGVGLNHDFNHWKFNSSMFSQGVMPLSFTPKPSKYANALFEEMSGYWMDLKPKDDVSAVVNIATWMRRFTCDFISLLTTEKQSSTIHYYYRKLKNEAPTKEMIESEEFIESINTFVSDNQIMFVPKMIKDLPFIKNRVERLLTNNYMFYGRLKNIVIKRRKELEKNINNDNDYLKTKQLDLLTSLIVVNTPYDTRPQKNVNPALLRPMTDDEIRGVMFDAFVAGTDTTVNTFCFVVYYISHHPEVKKKLFEEIDSVFKDDPTREVTTTDLEKLKYCEAIIKETSRIRPTVSMISRYSDKPDEIAGYKWPSKTLFIMYVRGINNNSLYWKDPEKFIPERFYDPEQIANQHKNSFLMFGGGPRMCLGRKVAMIELKTLLTLVYRKFDVELEDMKAPLKIATSTITFCKDLNIKLTPRELTTRA